MRIIKIENETQAKEEMLQIGADASSLKYMAPKAVSLNIKLTEVPVIAANIIKQEMLSFGGEACLSKGCINFSTKTSDILVIGTVKQIKELVSKLKHHHFGLPKISEELESALSAYFKEPAPLKIGKKNLAFGKKTYIMGILNITPDSFYDGGSFFTHQSAIEQGLKMINLGADFLDIGGESSRPGSLPVTAEEEIRRVIPVISALKKKGVFLSIDTQKSEVAEAALRAGASIINDISAFRHDKNMAKIAKKHKAPAILMHMQGTPLNMQIKPSYFDVINEIIAFLKDSLEIAQQAGIPKDKIIIDPGFGFGKTVEHNLAILKNLEEFKILGCPLLVGTSRKSTIGKVLDLKTEERLFGTAATIAIAISNGVDIIRVHDVKEMSEVAKMCDQIVRR